MCSNQGGEFASQNCARTIAARSNRVKGSSRKKRDSGLPDTELCSRRDQIRSRSPRRPSRRPIAASIERLIDRQLQGVGEMVGAAGQRHDP